MEAHIKEAVTAHPVAGFIRERWSARAFADMPIPEEQMATIFEAATWASSSMNAQPWRFVYGNKGDTVFNGLFDVLMPGNQPWAKNAAVLIAVIAHLRHGTANAVNTHAMHDVGAAQILLLLQARELGIYGHQMGGFYRDKAREFLGLNDDYEIATIIALGYLGDPEQLTEPFRSRELMSRSRKPLQETVFKSPQEFTRNI
jgi:nitroreductase